MAEVYQIDPYETELIEGCLRNERAVQKKLYDRYKQAMYTVAYRILNDHDIAHDALQDAFVQIFGNLRKFKKESSLGAWIKTIVVRNALLKLKREKNYETIGEDYDGEVIEWHDSLTAAYLEKAIQSLPAGYRTVFLLVEVEGYSHKETADHMNISEGTSKSQLYHAKKMLQGKLKELRN